jgi:hypothetical protein
MLFVETKSLSVIVAKVEIRVHFHGFDLPFRTSLAPVPIDVSLKIFCAALRTAFIRVQRSHQHAGLPIQSSGGLHGHP